MAYRVTVMKLNYPTKSGKDWQDRIVSPGELVPADVQDATLLNVQELSGLIAFVPDEHVSRKRTRKPAQDQAVDPAKEAHQGAEAS